MQRVTMVRYTAKPERADENEALSRAVFDELRAKTPAGVAYALGRDGDDFVHVFINFNADESEPVTGLPTFKAFEADAASRWLAPPVATRLGVRVIEAYGFERSPAMAK
jgi:hypothetical protein